MMPGPTLNLSALALLGLHLSPLAGPLAGPVKPALPRRAARPVATAGPDLYLGRPRLLIERTGPRRVVLRWNAVPETNTQGYRVERSADADHWTAYDYDFNSSRSD